MEIDVPAKFECPVCEEPFESLADKKHHIKSEHPKEKK